MFNNRIYIKLCDPMFMEAVECKMGKTDNWGPSVDNVAV